MFPHTRTVDVSDDFFGTVVPDPYRWLEDADDPEVAAWLRVQADLARGHLDALPHRERIAAALHDATGGPRSGLPIRRGANWFRLTNDGSQQQDVLIIADTPFGAGRVLIDPAPLLPDASVAIATFAPSPDGSLVAYSYLEAGSDWRTWRVRDVATGIDHPELIRWSKFTWPCWLPDGSGFIHGCFDAPERGEYISANSAHRLELHRLGTDQSSDEYVLSLPDEHDVILWPAITDDGRWLVVEGTRGTEHAARVWIRDLTDPEAVLRPLLDRAEARWMLLGSSGDELLMLTDLDAPLGRVVAVDAHTATVRELVAEDADSLAGGRVAGGRLVLHRLHDAASRVLVHDLDGGLLHEVALPGPGSVLDLEGHSTQPIVHLAWTSFTEPPGVLALDVSTGLVSAAFAVALDSDLVTEQIWVASSDGVSVPVFLVHRPGLTAADGPYATWLYGYGGFGHAMTPEFEPTRYAFAQAGGIVAIAGLRGGGEFGTAWHDAGRREHKQQVFDDAIAVAEHLITSGWTDTQHLALSGRSNGGLLAGAVLTQRPDLFAAVVPEVGVLDMLRFPLWTIGWAWTSDYGDPRADESQFGTLLAYSPLHNLRPDAGYPPVLVLTSDHDDRVVPAHSLKFTARLQAVSSPDATVVLRVERSGGHKEGRSRAALVAERTDVLAFISGRTGLNWR